MNSSKLQNMIYLLIIFLNTSFLFANTEIKWQGHAAFQITTPKNTVILIDPWITNPANPDGKKEIESLSKVNFILVTHGHSDHIGDTVEIGKKTAAMLVTNFELANNMKTLFHYPENQIKMSNMLNIGGETTLDDEIEVFMTDAIHSSSIEEPKEHLLIEGGHACGFVLKIKNGPTIYHTGDTAYFKGMEEIGKTFHPDLALINIGGHFGMSPEMAAKAALSVQARYVVPHHFKTFPILTQDSEHFTKHLSHLVSPKVLNVGEKLVFQGSSLVN